LIDSGIINKLRSKKILITGGLGFVGINFASTLLSWGINPVIADYYLIDQITNLASIPFDIRNVDYHSFDLSNESSTLNLISETSPDYVIHLAGMTDLKKDFETAYSSVEINIKGTLYLLKGIKLASVSRFVFISTSDIYGDCKPPFKENQMVFPASPYSVSKASVEMYCKMFNKVFNLPIVILRAFNLFGKYQKSNRVIPYIIQNLLQDQEVLLTKGEQKREFNYVDNLIDAIILSLNSSVTGGEIINIGSGNSISIRDIALKIGHRLNNVDKLKFGAIPYRPNEIWDMYCDNSRAKELLHWEPRINLDNGLDLTIEWNKKNCGNKMS